MLQKKSNALLLLIKSFVKLNRLKPKFLQKALVLIDLKLGEPCCSEPDAVVSLVTPQRNNFINAIEQMLKPMDRMADRNTLIKAKQLLEAALVNPCCI